MNDDLKKGGKGSGEYIHKKNIKHDFKIEDGAVKFEFCGKQYVKRGFNFIVFIKEHKLEDYFENIQYHTLGFTYIYNIKNKDFLKGKIKGDGNWVHVPHMPLGSVPVIKNVKPSISNPFMKATEDIANNDSKEQDVEKGISDLNTRDQEIARLESEIVDLQIRKEEEILKECKPDLNLNFIDVKDLVYSNNPIEYKEIQDKISKSLNSLKSLTETIYE